MTDFEAHLMRQIAWSRATFGPSTRHKGVIDHIRKELIELEKADSQEEISKEWTDVVLLALDGLWRSFHKDTTSSAFLVVQSILAKQDKNELRDWPNWRDSSPDQAIEHDRSKD